MLRWSSIVSSCCLKKHFFKVVTHQQDWSSIVCLLWWSSIVSSFFWREHFPISLSPFFSFPLFFLSYFFISILLDFSKRLISQNIWGLIKHHWKTAFKQFFKGIAHEQPWSSILCLLWWTSIVSSFFEVIFFQCPCLLSFSFPLVLLFYFLISILLDFSKRLMSQNPSLLSFARAFVSYLVQFSWHPLLDFYGGSMDFL